MVSITQSTEVGTVYTAKEIAQISELCRKENLFLHLDGARLANAAASLGCGLKEITTDVGVDVLSFGVTKNGAMGAEAVVFLNSSLAPDFKFFRKQLMQLSSKMRFVAVQFEALFTDDLWRRNALHANRMAQFLANEIKQIPQIKLCHAVQANGLFVQMPRAAISRLLEKHFFYVLNEERGEVRWMTSFDTTENDIRKFLSTLQSAIGKN